MSAVTPEKINFICKSIIKLFSSNKAKFWILYNESNPSLDWGIVHNKDDSLGAQIDQFSGVRDTSDTQTLSIHWSGHCSACSTM